MRIEGAPLDSGPPREIAFDSESESTTRGRLGIARRRCRVSQRVGVWKPLGIGVERKVGRGREEDQNKDGGTSPRAAAVYCARGGATGQN